MYVYVRENDVHTGVSGLKEMATEKEKGYRVRKQ